MKVEDKSFTFRLPSALLDVLQTAAARDDLSVAQLVRRVLREFVASEVAAEVKS